MAYTIFILLNIGRAILNSYEHVANLMKALAHPVRLRIMRVLAAEGEACVCHLEARLGLRQAYLSQQLARLRQAGLVEDRKDGLNVYYAVGDPDAGRLLGLLVEMASANLPKGWEDPDLTSNVACPCPKCARDNHDAA